MRAAFFTLISTIVAAAMWPSSSASTRENTGSPSSKSDHQSQLRASCNAERALETEVVTAAGLLVDCKLELRTKTLFEEPEDFSLAFVRHPTSFDEAPPTVHRLADGSARRGVFSDRAVDLRGVLQAGVQRVEVITTTTRGANFATTLQLNAVVDARGDCYLIDADEYHALQGSRPIAVLPANDFVE